MCFIYTIYTEKVRKKRREDNNDYDADADKRTAAHRSSSSYDIDNSPVEREAEAVFPMHILHKRVSFPPRSPLCKRPHPVARGWAHSHIYRGTHSPGMDLVKLRRSNAGVGGGVSVVVLSLTATKTLLLFAPVAPSLPHIHIFLPQLSISQPYVSFRLDSRNTDMHYSPDTCSRYLCRVHSCMHIRARCTSARKSERRERLYYAASV